MAPLQPSLQEWVRLEKLDANEVAVHPRYPIQLTSHPAAATVTTAPAPQVPFVPPQQVLTWLKLPCHVVARHEQQWAVARR